MFSLRPNKVLPTNATSHEIITEVLCAIKSDLHEDSINAFKTLVNILSGSYKGRHPRRGNWMRPLARLDENDFAPIPAINELITDQRKVIAAIEKKQAGFAYLSRTNQKKILSQRLEQAFGKENYKAERYLIQEMDLLIANEEAKRQDEIFRRDASNIIQSEYLGDEAPKIVADVILLIQQDASVDIIEAIFTLRKLLNNISANIHVCQDAWVAALKNLRYLETIYSPEMENLLDQSSLTTNIHKYDRSAGLFIRHANDGQSLECQALRHQQMSCNEISFIRHAAPAVLGVAAVFIVVAAALRYTIPGRVLTNWAYNNMCLFKQNQHRDADINEEQQELLNGADQPSRLSF